MAINYRVVSRLKPGSQEESTRKYYPQLIRTQQIQEATIAEMIADRCTVKAPDVRGVLTALEDEFIRQLQAGNSIDLGDLGSFRPSVQGVQVAKPEDLRLPMLKRLHVVFTPRGLTKFDLTDDDVLFNSIEASPQYNLP